MQTLILASCNQIDKLINELIFSQKKVAADDQVTQKTVQEALDILRGACTIVYPMGLPPHEPIKMEFENSEDLGGKQVGSLSVSVRSMTVACLLSSGQVFPLLILEQ